MYRATVAMASRVAAGRKPLAAHHVSNRPHPRAVLSRSSCSCSSASTFRTTRLGRLGGGGKDGEGCAARIGGQVLTVACGRSSGLSSAGSLAFVRRTSRFVTRVMGKSQSHNMHAPALPSMVISSAKSGHGALLLSAPAPDPAPEPQRLRARVRVRVRIDRGLV